MENLTDSELALFLIQYNSIYNVKTFIDKNGQTVSIKTVDDIYVEMSKRSSNYWNNQVKHWTTK